MLLVFRIKFLSTPSARRATCGHPVDDLEAYGISIHALREEGDARTTRRSCRTLYFYPRPPRGGRRGRSGSGTGQRPISIHALREEGDRPRHGRGGGGWHFYPRPPRGGRPSGSTSPATRPDFYPRPPRGGRPPAGILDLLKPTISIHALREEGDRATISCCRGFITFLSTPSARRATRTGRFCPASQRISIHALREEGDRGRKAHRRCRAISIHALREEGDVFAHSTVP